MNDWRWAGDNAPIYAACLYSEWADALVLMAIAPVLLRDGTDASVLTEKLGKFPCL